MVKIASIHTKAERLEARVTPKLKDLFLKVASMKGMSLTNFLISSAQKESEEFLKTQTLIDLTLSDKLLLVQTCFDNVLPNPKLQRAAAKFKKMGG